MQSKCTRWNEVPAQCDRLARAYTCTRLQVYLYLDKQSICGRYITYELILTEEKLENREFPLVQGKITPMERVKLHKYLERNRKATALIERNPHCTIRCTVRNQGANEHAGNRDSGIDSQHPYTYERIGPPIGYTKASSSP